MAATRLAMGVASGQCVTGCREGATGLSPALQQGERSSWGLSAPSSSCPFSSRSPSPSPSLSSSSSSSTSRVPSFLTLRLQASASPTPSSLFSAGHVCSRCSYAFNPLRFDPSLSLSRPRSHPSCGKPRYLGTPSPPARVHPHPYHQLRSSSGPAGTAAAAAVVASAASSAGLNDIPTVADTKSAFLQSYKRPIPTLYNTGLQELLVQHHLIRWNAAYKYDPITALGFVTVFDALMDGYPDPESRDAIFRAYVLALQEDPDQYRKDAVAILEWAAGQDSTNILAFAQGEGEGEGSPSSSSSSSFETALKELSVRAAAKRKFKNNRFFAVGLQTLAGAVQSPKPTTVEDLCKALNVGKVAVERDLDVYRNLLQKLQTAKELLREFLDREKKKQAQRDAQKTETTTASPSEG
ncbi:hypothetical protein CBR_g78876 [Chara braunii]|uniref:Uncharacterized protein n=1 Tax=Chara braunii TaxID=69332 RepID=A0A388KAK5_CHABU|nr:hypothetical protein CBR_g78876 [Chara braunii]|eukprot:GBG67095.1 hypothetical protein CBR_g78876 [Chara braunii]